MKYIAYILLLGIIVSCSNNETFEIDVEEFETELTPWLEFYKKYDITLDKFKFSKVDSLPYLAYNVDTFDIEKDIYKSFYKYSADSSKILDLVSYNLVLELDDRNRLISFTGSLDCEVYIKHLNNNICQKVLFFGPSYMLEDGFWIDDDKLLIIGQNLENGEDKTKPLIWIINIRTNTIQYFEYSETIKNMKCNYIENEKFKEASIDFN